MFMQQMKKVMVELIIDIQFLNQKKLYGLAEITLLEDIQFQNGPRNSEGSQHGILDTDLLEIVRHRMQCFQAGPFATDYNDKALEHIELALMYMNRRVEDRIERNVLGTNKK